MPTELKKDISWVGFVDWNVRDFHGYRTDRGSTYNAYLVKDEKTALIDTVKAPFAGRLLANVAEVIDPGALDYVVCNHAEPDHSGSLPAVMAACDKVELVCDERCREVLARHYDTSGWKFKVVADGEELSLGRRTLTFIETPMVHWPESMATYVPQEKLLFSMDGFGQHLAASNRFDDENPLDVIMAEAKSYYANILMLYGSPIGRTLEKAAGLDIEMIAPSHGVIWRKNLGAIISAYQGWIVQRPAAKVLVVYDSMWQSTAMMAQAIMEGASGEGVEAKLMHIRSTGNTRIVTEVLDAAAIAFGSPTLNGTMMPQVAATLTYLKGLKPAGKAGFVFGSYGWAKGAGKDMGEYLAAMKFDVLREPLLSQNVPGEEVLDECRAAGKMLAGKARELASAAG